MKKYKVTISNRFRYFPIFGMGIVSLFYIACSSVPVETVDVLPSYKLVELKDVPGISPEVLSAQGRSVRIETPLPYFSKERIAIFDVTILDIERFNEQQHSFAGDSTDILNLIREVHFVQGNAEPNFLQHAEQMKNGAGEAVVDMAEGIWKLLSHPIDTLKELAKGVAGLAEYLKRFWDGEVRPKDDARGFAQAYFENTCMAIATEHEFDFAIARTEEAKALVQHLAKPRMTGEIGTQLLAVFLPFTKLSLASDAGKAGKIQKVAQSVKVLKETGVESKAGGVAKYGEVFAYGEKARTALAKAAIAAEAERKISNLEKISILLNPQKVQGLGKNGLNSKLHKVMYYLNQEERAGRNVSESVTRAMKMSGADRRIPKSLLDPKIDRMAILQNYETAKRTKIFEGPGNLERMKRGLAPTVYEGEFAGQVIHVDHIIPQSHAPELGNVWGNLRYVPERPNVLDSNKLKPASLSKLQEYKDARLIDQNRINSIIRIAAEAAK